MVEGDQYSKRVLSIFELNSALRRIRGVVFDFDGVFTDNRVWVSEDGRESVACWRSDGLGLARVRLLGLPMAILSTEVNPVVLRRAEKLRLDCLHGLHDKATAFQELTASHGLQTSDFAYIGNDINDNQCLTIAGLAVIPADAHPAVRPLANLILANGGGRGAVREFFDLLCGARNGD